VEIRDISVAGRPLVDDLALMTAPAGSNPGIPCSLIGVHWRGVLATDELDKVEDVLFLRPSDAGFLAAWLIGAAAFMPGEDITRFHRAYNAALVQVNEKLDELGRDEAA